MLPEIIVNISDKSPFYDQGCDQRHYHVIYVNVLKIDGIYVIFDFEDVIRYFCQNETLFLSN